MIEKLKGIIPPLATPLTPERKIDVDALRKLIRYAIDGRVHAIFVMGSTGEFPAFSREDRRFVIETAANEVGGRIPVLAGISDAGTELAVRNAKDAEEAGADAVVATLPYYFRTSADQEALDHFRYIAENARLPLIVYNIPQMVKSPLKVSVVKALAEEGTAVAVKDSATDFNHFQELLFNLRHLPNFAVFQGSEFQIAASVLMGAQGCVLGVANIIPDLCVQLYETASRGEVEKSRELQRRITDISQVFKVGESFLGGLKAAMSMFDLCGQTTAMPVAEASEETRQKVRKILEANELL